ncbi:sensor histidine kinase [Nocardioides sp. JQ2195]|uniref:sensor histidine kinase n=1 Tax=Nocardioides sp. JQ2195 TaxID=2592334 RepID=UPI00143ED5C8|nr:sensor histidine kinase [Nocardioides sp. JQ2195]QIX27376.1 sensor histidine kinase [Nocardioides sp. JQ2195]
MLSAHGFSLSSRVIAINGLLFALGTALLAFSPATVSSRPLWSEVIVLVVGLAVMIVANGVLVGGTLRPLDRLVTQLDRVRSTEPVERLPVPRSGLGHDLAESVNDLFARIDTARRDSSLAALAAQEAERARIAQELHDGVGQSLTAVLLELGAIVEQADPDTAAALTGVRETTRASLDEVRGVARQLRPHVLEDLGLRSALVALTTELFSHGETHVRRGIMPGLPALDDPVELVVFRVAQEALTNVARHARARTVELTLNQVGTDVVLTVRDDGIGIAPGAVGTGVRGMRERATLVDGQVEIGRRDGGGTQVRLVVPA